MSETFVYSILLTPESVQSYMYTLIIDYLPPNVLVQSELQF